MHSAPSPRLLVTCNERYFAFIERLRVECCRMRSRQKHFVPTRGLARVRRRPMNHNLAASVMNAFGTSDLSHADPVI
jgi:hypothetical protein